MYLEYKSIPYCINKDLVTSTPVRNDVKYDFNRLLLFTIIAAGITIRLFHFVDNRSLWMDELYLNVNLIKMNFRELATLPLEYEQKAPIGYLWIVRLCVLLFGKGEMALRLFSLICGIGSLLLFVPVARHFLKPWAVAIAVGMLAFSGPAIYHSVEAKQYSAELFATIAVLYLFTRYSWQQANISALLKWGLLGGSVLLFSNSAIFVLAGIAFAISLNVLLKKDWVKLFRYLIPFSVWLLCFALIYTYIIGEYKNSEWLIYFFEHFNHAFMPVPPLSVSDLEWFVRVAYKILQHPLGLLLNFKSDWDSDYSGHETLLRLPILFLFSALVSVVYLIRKDKLTLAILAFPVLLALFASGLKLYPFYERFLLFMAPLFILLVSLGVERIYRFFACNAKLAVVLPCLLLLPLLWNVGRTAADTNLFYKKQFNREALLLVNEEFQEGDVVYIYWNATHSYKYYKDAYNLKYEAILGKDRKNACNNPEEYLEMLLDDLEGVKQKNRVWFIYNSSVRNNIGDFVSRPKWYHEPDFIPGKMLEATFSAYGKKHDRFISNKGLVVTLFELAEN